MILIFLVGAILYGCPGLEVVWKFPLSSTSNPENLIWASLLLFISWFFDMMDGLMARLLKATSAFGGQLDSLCDVVSFGVVPALLVLMTSRYLEISPLVGILVGLGFLSTVLVRLARFNIEAESSEQGHLYFKGLPSSAAALLLASLTLWHQSLIGGDGGMLYFSQLGTKGKFALGL